MSEKFDVIIVGGGASGLMCAARAGLRHKKVLVLDNGPKPGRKILMAGGGRCNFTNRSVTPENFICTNPHFVKSALRRYTQDDFIERVAAENIGFHEREHGQLFCNDSAARILDMLLKDCPKQSVTIQTRSSVDSISRDPDTGIFHVRAGARRVNAPSLVIATGGPSIPAAGASSFGYQVAKQFKINVIAPRPGLVPFTLAPKDKATVSPLAGISVKAKVACTRAVFTEQLLFTHRGLSGPVILQVSSYWQPGDPICIDLLPDMDLGQFWETARKTHPKKGVRNLIAEHLPRRLVDLRLAGIQETGKAPAALSRKTLDEICDRFHRWEICPGGTEGNRTAEVTVGGVDCNAISSKTFEAAKVPGLFFIGEVLDVTGQLGGYNLQWAWSSGFCAGAYV